MKRWLIAAAIVVCAAPRPDASQMRLFGGPPTDLSTPYKSEHAWATGESAADLAEMATAARGIKPAFVVPAGLTPWDPDALVPLAIELFGASPAKASREPALGEQYPALADFTAVAIVRASDAVSTALRGNMRSARAHEAAAFVLGTFALREAADDLSDVRWALNRMTAHLAAAGALRGADAVPSLDGQLGRVILLGLANRTASALSVLDGLPDRRADAAWIAWQRALRMRLTHDWRVSPAPAAALRIEKVEYFRARRKTLNSVRAGQELSALGERVAVDVARIVQSFSHGVEDGNTIVEPALGGEWIELSEIYRLMHGRDLSPALPGDVINVRAGRLMSSGRATVISWGAWAEMFQRHAGMYAGEIDDHYRKMLGLPSRADEIKRRIDALLGHLTFFPVASARRTKGDGAEADLTHINAAIALAVRAPELVNYDFWRFLARGANYEVVKQGMPDQSKWFVPPTAAVPYEAGIRGAELLGQLSLQQLEALVDEASSDVSLAARALAPRPGSQELIKRIVAWLKVRGAYDLYAIDAAVRWARTMDEQIEWRRQGCALAVPQCLALGSLLYWSGNEAGAVEEYERAFRDPGLDQVALANSSSWLVSYYERTGQLTRAEDLAQRSAAIGSATGLQTLAAFYERRRRIDEAGAVLEGIAGRYRKSSGSLAGFLYRQAVEANNPKYLARWKQVERELFPSGLHRLPATLPAPPATGVWVDDIGSTERRLRVQIGDIIVGVDGWRVENLEQYDAVMAFTEPHVVRKITLSRGVLFTVDLPKANGMKLDSYPLRGWIR